MDLPSIHKSTPARPRVSVILTVYKRIDYLAEALRSALAQSYKDFEIIVADDSGTAAARSMVDAFGLPDRIRYRANPATLGIVVSLAQAAAHARGDFLAILNDDDLWEPSFLERLVRPLEADSNRVLAFGDYWMMQRDGKIDHELSENCSKIFGRAELEEGVVPAAVEFLVIRKCAAIAQGAIFRKDALDWSLFVPEVSGAYDYWICCLLATTGKPIYYIPQRLARWRVHGAMESVRGSHDKSENVVYIYSTMIARNWFPEFDAVLRVELADALMSVGRDKLYFGRAREARKYFWRCYLLSRRPRALGAAVLACIPSSARKGVKIVWDLIRGKWGRQTDPGVDDPFRKYRAASKTDSAAVKSRP